MMNPDEEIRVIALMAAIMKANQPLLSHKDHAIYAANLFHSIKQMYMNSPKDLGEKKEKQNG